MLLTRSAPTLILGSLLYLCAGSVARAQEPAAPPAYLAVVEGTATLVRDGEAQPAVRDMPFVTGDRLRTEAGRVEIDFPDGSAIEVGPYSEVVALSPTRVRLTAGTMDHLPRRDAQTDSDPYLPQDLQRYGQTFDQYGSWNYDTSYGYVWYPRVAADWRPYYYGSWSTVPSYGWTWVGLDAWSWPTHHYGRWGHARNAWFWIPGRTWSAAWVSWGLTSDYVSWCPLGFDGRPVFALSAGLNGHGSNGWTVMSRSHFGYRGQYAHDYAVDPRRFDGRTPFVQMTRLPATVGPDRQAARHVAGALATPAGVAVPRGTAPTERRTPTVEPRAANDYRRPADDTRPMPRTEPRTPRAEPAVPNAEPRTWNAEPRTWNAVPRTPSPERRIPISESRTPNAEPRTRTAEPRTPNAEPRTPNAEPRSPNRFERGLPMPAPRVVAPIVRPVAAPMTPPARTKVTPDSPRPAPQYRPPVGDIRPPSSDARPRANDSPQRTPPPERSRASERPPPQARAAPRSAPAPPQANGKAETTAKRPR